MGFCAWFVEGVGKLENTADLLEVTITRAFTSVFVKRRLGAEMLSGMRDRREGLSDTYAFTRREQDAMGSPSAKPSSTQTGSLHPWLRMKPPA